MTLLNFDGADKLQVKQTPWRTARYADRASHPLTETRRQKALAYRNEVWLFNGTSMTCTRLSETCTRSRERHVLD